MPSKEVELVLNLPLDQFFEYHSNEEIAEPGLRHINLMLLAMTGNHDLPSDFDRSFNTKQGRFSKRASAYFKKRFGITLDEKTLTTVGNLANKYTVRHSIVYEFTRDFNWRAGEFGDHSSCFWGGNSSAKGMILANGGYAIRLFNFEGKDPNNTRNHTHYGVGRAWILPAYLKDGNYPIVFNAYRKNGYSFETRDFAEIVARHLSDKIGEEYSVKRIRLSNNDETGGLLYLNRNVYENGMRQENPKLANNSGGYLVAPESILRGVDFYDFNLSERSGYDYEFDDEELDEGEHCPFCDEWVENEDFTWIEHYYGINRGEHICNSCAESDHFTRCTRCRAHVWMRDEFATTVLTIEGHHSEWCPRCAENHAVICDGCGEMFSTATRERDGAHLNYLFDENTNEYHCQSCAENLFACEHCHSVFDSEDKHEIDGKIVCEACHAELYDAEISLVKFPNYAPLNMAIFKNPLEDTEGVYELEGNALADSMTRAVAASGMTVEDTNRMLDSYRSMLYEQLGVPENQFRIGSPSLQQAISPIVEAWTIREENEDEE